MTVNNIDLETIIKLLKSLPKEKEYKTETILFARGKYKYHTSLIKSLKQIING